MATDTAEIITIYKAQVEGYLQEITKIQAKVKELAVIEKKQASDADINARELKSSAAQRNKLLQDEIKNLASLQAASKKAFTIPEIKDFNNRIAESQKNISLLKGETGKVSSVTSALKGQFLSLGAGILAAFSINAIKNFAVDTVHAFQESQKSAKLLESAIKNVAGGDDSAVGKFLNQSKQLQLTTIFSDEQVQQAQTLAFQFGLTQAQVEKIIPVIADFASATGQDLQSALEAVLRGVEGQARGLKIYGIEVKHTGDVTKDLAQITDQLNQKFQGQADVIGQTSIGAMKRLGNQFDELKEKIGGAIANSDLFNGIIFQLTNRFQTLSDLFTSAEEKANEHSRGLIERSKKQIEKDIEELQKKGLTRMEALHQIAEETGKAANDVSENLTRLDNKVKATFEIKEEQDLKKKRDSILATAAAVQELFKAESKLKPIDLNITSIDKLKEKLADLNNQLSALPLNKITGIAIDPQEQQRLVKAIKDTQDKIDAINGKAAEEQKKKDKEIRDQKLAEEKKLIDNINKLTVETELDPTKKISKQKEIDEKLAQVQIEDKRSLAEILKSIEEKSAQDQNLIRLKSFQDQSKLEIERNFTQDEQNLTDFVNKERELLLSRNLTSIQLDKELTTLNEFELQRRLQNAIDANTGIEKDTKESQERIAKAQDELNKFEIENLKKAAAERISVQQEIQKELLRAKRLQVQEGSLEDIQIQKDNATALADIELQGQLDIINSINATEQQKQDAIEHTFLVAQKLNNDLTELTNQENQIRARNFQDTFDTIADASVQLFSTLNQLSNANTQNRIKDLEDERDAAISNSDFQLSNVQANRDKNLISERTFEKQSEAIKEQRIASEKRINDAIRAEKRKAAEREKAIAIFEATLNFAKAIIVALSSAPPPFNAALAAISAALAGVQLAATIATPLPQFKLGTKRKEKSGLAIVGEEGEELVNLPIGSQVLPHRQTIKHKRIINSMFDNTFEDLIHTDYVIPEMEIERKKFNEKLKIFTAEINSQFSYKFSEPFISKILLTQKQKHEDKKQESFAENIAKAIVINSKSEIKSDAMSMWDYLYLHNSTKMLNSKKRDYSIMAEMIAEKLAEKLK